MAKMVRLRVVDNVAIVTLMAEPVNAMTPRLRAAVWAAIERIDTDPDIKAAIILSKERAFSLGVDVRDLGHATVRPTVAELCARIEGCSKPVIAAAAGMALNGGAELMLAAHYRIAMSKVRIGFRDVTLGLTPAGGATQRLPRLIGAAGALDVLLSGRTVDAPSAKALGLVDGIVDEDFGARVVGFAKTLIQKGARARPTGERRSRFQDGRAYQKAIAAARAGLVGTVAQAPHCILDCVEAAALLPFETGLLFEQDAYARCYAHPQSRALRHVFLAERRIDNALMDHVEGAPKPVVPMGEATVIRLRHALDTAGKVLMSQGVSNSQIDGAMVAYGFADGPFRTGAAPSNDATIADRIVSALLVEGAACVAQGAVQRPSDIDVLAVHGLGFPRHLGGPFRATQTTGLIHLRTQLRTWANDSAIWAVPELLNEAIKDARGFDAPAFDSTLKA